MKIIYLYNKDNWALHNVGKVWFSLLPDGVYVEMINYHIIEDRLEEYCKEYDYVWFSYLYMYKKFMYDPARAIVSIHDPMEVFPQESGWKTMPPITSQVRLLSDLKHINVVSKEMQDILVPLGIKTSLIPTTSLLHTRAVKEIKTVEVPRVISVCNIYPRKNIELLDEIAEQLKEGDIDIYLKIGGDILSTDEYSYLLAKNNIYVCASYQEGGPISAMDAMCQGCVVLTTPVGQMLELIQEGYNGYFCNSKEEFVEKCHYLGNNPQMFRDMRRNAITTMHKKRSQKFIFNQVQDFLKTLI